MKEKFIEKVKKIIMNDGKCYGVGCSRCPFYKENSNLDKEEFEKVFGKNVCMFHTGKEVVIFGKVVKQGSFSERIEVCRKYLELFENENRKENQTDLEKETEVKVLTSEHNQELVEFLTKLKAKKIQVKQKDWNVVLGVLPNERIEDTQEFKDKHKHQSDTNNIKPNHYKLNIKGQDVEVMDIIDAVVKEMDGRKGYIVGNILKYVCRAEKKNGLEDYKKARTYLDMLLGE